MTWLGPALWGMFGAFAIESLDFWTAVRRHGRWPWQGPDGDPGPGAMAYGIAEALRLVVGAGVSAAGCTSLGHGGTAWLAMTLGAAAPIVLEKLCVLVPLAIQGSVAALTAEATAAMSGAGARAGGASPYGRGGGTEGAGGRVPRPAHPDDAAWPARLPPEAGAPGPQPHAAAEPPLPQAGPDAEGS